jgi:hypothetical protein
MESITNASRRVVAQFWEAMNTNDFRAAAAFLDAAYVLEWPQSGERIRGPENFIAVNDTNPQLGARGAYHHGVDGT